MIKHTTWVLKFTIVFEEFMSKHILIDKNHNIIYIKINRSDSKNAITSDMFE